MILVRTLVVGFLLLLSSQNLLAQSWSTGYYPGWEQSRMPASELDLSALTHIMHFSIIPRVDGSLDYTTNVLTLTSSNEAVAKTHAAGKKILVSVGGWQSASGFRAATSSNTLAVFVQNLVSFMRARGYDGLDLDWEPLEASDSVQFGNLVRALRSELDKLSPRPLLTAAMGHGQHGIVAPVASHLDQVNIMTYDQVFTWTGVSGHHAALSDGGVRDQWGQPLPSVNSAVQAFVGAGIPRSKIGIGMAFYGYVWSGGGGTSTGGVTRPGQTWTTTPGITAASYVDIMENYYQDSYYRWDSGAMASYLGLDFSGSTSDKFITYEDHRSITEKVNYVKNSSLGGFIIWSLGQAYFPLATAGQKHPLLNSVKLALGSSPTPEPAPVDTIAPTALVSQPSHLTYVPRSSTVTVQTSATDNVGVSNIVVFVNGAQICTLSVASGSCSFKTSRKRGQKYDIRAQAKDAAGNIGSSSTVRVTTQ